MHKHTGRAAVLGVAAIVATVGLTGGASASPAVPRAATAVVPGPNTVGTAQLKNQAVTAAKIGPSAVWGSMIHTNTIPLDRMGWDFRQAIAAADVSKADAIKSSTQIKAGTIAESDLDAALRAKIDGPGGPAYLKNWGEIFRNTIGNARAELGQSSSGEGLNFNVPTGQDAVMWGNEADFAGKPVALSAVKYEVFQTGENSAIAGNMPSIKFEISNPATGATYTTLVYSPDNSTSNAWTKIDAAADTGNHWGFTGTYFNSGTDKCGINGSRCTLTEALSKLGDSAKFISAGVGKGRDNAWHGAVRSLTIGGTTYNFTASGVVATN
ncbi:hypothetical protein E0H73_31280 [Kribbella pittospori]|uniref:Uncharacterized protein n=1 Tax=Kribbella pittospori TaxID=722689 RepID=A0A4R0KCZ1_9ACTN|nr:hypothetical protein [Kribbella pittospori]TCC56974.1 hypothetical protein E0H73_31280 [Kribbella pittospori]